MNRVVVAGICTEVGKTLVSSVLVETLEADYWKPVQSGNLDWTDSQHVHSLVSPKRRIFPEAYRLQQPLSPHHAAALDGIEIDLQTIRPPKTKAPLVIEMAGGVLVPVNNRELLIDALAPLTAQWVLVVRHYLGSINHSLMSIEVLRARGIDLAGVIISGKTCPQSEKAISEIGQVPILGRLEEESDWNCHTVRRYAEQWKDQRKLSLQTN